MLPKLIITAEIRIYLTSYIYIRVHNLDNMSIENIAKKLVTIFVALCKKWRTLYKAMSINTKPFRSLDWMLYKLRSSAGWRGPPCRCGERPVSFVWAGGFVTALRIVRCQQQQQRAGRSTARPDFHSFNWSQDSAQRGALVVIACSEHPSPATLGTTVTVTSLSAQDHRNP